jgi:hypothetical protein
MREQAKRGFWNAGQIPYGYHRDQAFVNEVFRTLGVTKDSAANHPQAHLCETK